MMSRSPFRNMNNHLFLDVEALHNNTQRNPVQEPQQAPTQNYGSFIALLR